MDQRTSAPPELAALRNTLMLVRAMAGRGQQATTALSNHNGGSNTAPIGPMQIASFAATLTPVVSGKVLFMGEISGTFSAVDLEGTAAIVIDGAAALAAPVATCTAGHVVATGGTMLFAILSVTKAAHSFAIQLDSGAGHTITVPDGQASITLIELPG